MPPINHSLWTSTVRDNGTDPLTAINTRATPQSRPADARQVPNNAGGYGFKVSDDARLRRFLTIGTSGGTYHVTEAELTKANADVVLTAARERGANLVDLVVQISTAGRAPRQNPGIFALAAVAGLGDDAARKAALAAVPAVCRTGTTLFQFVTYVEQFRGWGRGLRTAIGDWYLGKDVDALAYQMVKYRNRGGWSHRDLLRLAKPKPESPARDALFKWATTGKSTETVMVTETINGEPLTFDVGGLNADLPELVHAFTAAQGATSADAWTGLIESCSLSWEMLPDAALAEPKVWRALIEKGMPQTALLRQLPRLTRLGVLDGSTLHTVMAQLIDPERLRKARVHPVNVLVAQRTYASGRSQMGSSTWTPVRKVVDALDAAFYAAYGAIEPAGKRTLLALDVSGSMGSPVMGPQSKSRFDVAPGALSCREAGAALSLVTLATEPDTEIVGFTAGGARRGFGYFRESAITPLDITPRRRLDDVTRYTASLDFGGTDCALPMLWAKDTGKDFDTVIIYTDSESYAGPIHPHQALRQYREHVGHDVKFIVVALASNGISVADPADPSSIDIAGLDGAVPNLIADFSRGAI